MELQGGVLFMFLTVYCCTCSVIFNSAEEREKLNNELDSIQPKEPAEYLKRKYIDLKRAHAIELNVEREKLDSERQKHDLERQKHAIELNATREKLDSERQKHDLELTSERNQSKALADELNRFKYPITIGNEIDTFFETNDYKVKLSDDEERMVKNSGDPQRKSRIRMVKICEHILNDLDDSQISRLNAQMDDPTSLLSTKVSNPAERRNIFCNALVRAKSKRNKIHDLLLDGRRVRRINIFIDDRWNEAITIFVNVLAEEKGLLDSAERPFIEFVVPGTTNASVSN